MQTAGIRDLKSMREDVNYDLLKATRSQQVRQSTPILTKKGIDNGINVFKLADYAGKSILVYIPRYAKEIIDPETGLRDKFYVKIATRELRTVGTHKYKETFRDTTNLPPNEDAGITGNVNIGEFISLSFDYRNALRDKEAAIKFGTTDLSTLTEADIKSLYKSLNEVRLIGDAVEKNWFPIVVIECEEGYEITSKQGVRFKMVDEVDANGNKVLDANGQPKKKLNAKLMWYSVGASAYDTKFKEPFKAISREAEYDAEGNLISEAQGGDFGGYFGVFNFSTKDNKGEEVKKNVLMHLGKEFTFSFLSQEQSKYKKLYEGFAEQVKAWDVEANKYYGEYDLQEDVISCAVVPDVAVENYLAQHFANVPKEIDAIKTMTEAILAGGGSPTLGGADAVLAGSGQLGGNNQQALGSPQHQGYIAPQQGVQTNQGVVDTQGSQSQDAGLGMDFSWNPTQD